MKLKALTYKEPIPGVKIEKDKEYEVEDIIGDTYKIKVPTKKKFVYALLRDDEGVLVE